MERKQRLNERYSDLLGEQPDAALSRLIDDLDATYTAAMPPAHLGQASGQTLRERAASGRRLPVPLRRVSSPRRAPRRLVTVAASLLLAGVVLAGTVYAIEPILSRALDLDPGTQQILKDNQYQVLDVTHTIGGTTLTVQRAYADANRIIIGYTTTKQPGSSDNPASHDEFVLMTQDGTVLPSRGGAGYRDPGQAEASVISYDAASITGNLREVRLRLEVRAPEVATWSFDFSLPFHPGRVAVPRQSVTANGGTATLERVVVTPSETRVYLRGVGDYPIAKLSVGGWLGGWDSERGPVGVITSWTTPDGLTVISYAAALSNRHGDWTLTVSLAGNIAVAQPASTGTSSQAIQPTGGPWTFHFDVP